LKIMANSSSIRTLRTTPPQLSLSLALDLVKYWALKYRLWSLDVDTAATQEEIDRLNAEIRRAIIRRAALASMLNEQESKCFGGPKT
jgi:hypothetical protein